MDPTQTKVYRGTPEEQQAAFLADATEAAAFGWEPQSHQQEPGYLQVTYLQRPTEPPMPAGAASQRSPDSSGGRHPSLEGRISGSRS